MSVMSGLFGSKSPPPPTVPDSPPPPSRSDASERAKEEAAKIRRGQGRGSTILTSGQGVQGEFGAGTKKNLGE